MRSRLPELRSRGNSIAEVGIRVAEIDFRATAALPEDRMEAFRLSLRRAASKQLPKLRHRRSRVSRRAQPDSS